MVRCAEHRTEEEKLEWLKALEDAVRDSVQKRLSFKLGGQQRPATVTVSETPCRCLISVMLMLLLLLQVWLSVISAINC